MKKDSTSLLSNVPFPGLPCPDRTACRVAVTADRRKGMDGDGQPREPGCWRGAGQGGAWLRAEAAWGPPSFTDGSRAGDLTVPGKLTPNQGPTPGFSRDPPTRPGGAGGAGHGQRVRLAAEGTRVLGGSLTPPLLGGPRGTAQEGQRHCLSRPCPGGCSDSRGQRERVAGGRPLPRQGHLVPSGDTNFGDGNPPLRPTPTPPRAAGGGDRREATGTEHGPRGSADRTPPAPPYPVPCRPPRGWWV